MNGAIDAVRVLMEEPRAPAAFLAVIVLITVASLVAHRVRTARRLRAVGTTARRPWPPAVRAPEPVAAPVAQVRLRAVPEPSDSGGEPIGTLLLTVTPDGPVAATLPADLLGLEPGLGMRVRRADLELDALVAALPDEAAITLDDLTAAPADADRNARFRAAVDTTRPLLPCAVILTGPDAAAPVVALGTLALRPLLAEEPLLASLLAGAVATGADDIDRSAFATALLASVRARPISTLVDLDGLVTDDPWLAANRAELRVQYASFLGNQARSA
ncbi:hypothetical protein SAMN05443637_10315 [Pseudonocardia thermophila]|jgi:hypothetical protein|uniref:Uncharacterized protein n=2 Tax=Pseudonocardia thermophila TaxID=1848 RepID=A0A1M6Q0B7_PSETH|nr:hypothetical protein SAMN05443637_10315 [Pseudonocardia thermophila]